MRIAGAGSVVIRPPARNIGERAWARVVGRSVGRSGRDGMEWDGIGWDGMRCEEMGGYLSAAVRGEWRLVAAGEGAENGRESRGWGEMWRSARHGVAQHDAVRRGAARHGAE